MKVTALKEQVRNKERVSVFVDNKYAFSLLISQIIDEKIKVGLEVSEQDVKRFVKLSEEGKQYVTALAWVLSRPRSKKEFLEYAYRKKIDKDHASNLLTGFEKRGYVNDEVFARWWVELRTRKLKSRKQIVAELKTKGIYATDEFFGSNSDTEKEMLKEIIAKVSQKSRYADQKKLINYLLQKGFSYSSVKEVLAELSEGSDS